MSNEEKLEIFQLGIALTQALNGDSEAINVYKAIKAISNEKMGDVVVKDDGGINEIFHANKKKISELNRFKKRLDERDNLVNLVGGGDAHSPHPTDKERVWATDTKVCSPTNDIIPQTNENKSIAELIKAESKDFDTLSTNEGLALLEKNQQSIAGMQSTKDLQQQNKDSMGLKQEKELKDSKNQESQIGIRKRHR